MKQPIKLDKTDRRLIYELEKDCRQSLTSMAKKIGVSKQVVLYKINRLKKTGVIRMFSIVIDEAALGYMHFEVWIQLKNLETEKREILEDYLYKNKKVTFLAKTGPPFDLVVGLSALKIADLYGELRTISMRFPDMIQDHHVTITGEAAVYSRSYLLGKEDEERKKKHLLAAKPKDIKLDQLDANILNELSVDSRVPTIKLAKKLNLSPTTLRAKIKRLERQGVIQAYRAVIEPTRIGIQPYELLIMSQNMDEGKEKELETFCMMNDHVVVVLRLIGRWNLDILFDAENQEQYSRFLADIRTRFGIYIKEYACPSINSIIRQNYHIEANPS